MGFNTHYGATWGSLEVNAYFENLTDKTIVASFRDVSLFASIWLESPDRWASLARLPSSEEWAFKASSA